TTTETIEPVARPPWWKSPLEVTISGSKDEAEKQYNDTIKAIIADTSIMCIYTDGSGIDNGVGAAAYCSNTLETRQEYLGTESTHNVFGAELVAIELATEMMKQKCEQYKRCLYYSDSQAA